VDLTGEFNGKREESEEPESIAQQAAQGAPQQKEAQTIAATTANNANGKLGSLTLKEVTDRGPQRGYRLCSDKDRR